MPFPISVVFSAVSAAANLAWIIYDKGLKSNFPYDQDYTQLVNAVGEFHITLQEIQNVLSRANNVGFGIQVEGSLLRDHSPRSFKTIVGDFQATLEDCQKLLEAKESYGRGGRGLTTKITWNVFAKEDVRELRNRLAFHNTRLSLTLQPLKLSLALDLFEVTQNGQRAILGDLAEIKAFLGITSPATSPPPDSPLQPLPAIPDYLRARFDIQAETEKELPLSDEIRISSVMGHLTEIPSTPGSSIIMPRDQVVRRYVNLMKAAWILTRPDGVLAHNRNTSSTFTIETWKDLWNQVRNGLLEFENLPPNVSKPNTDEMSILPSIQFSLWLFQPGSRPMEPKIARESEIVLLDVALEAETATERQQLLVVGSLLQRQTLRIVTSFMDSLGRSRERNTDIINTRTAVLQPTYAQPDAELCNVQLRTSVEDHLDMTLQFRNYGDLFQFQRCITGFAVKHHQSGLTGLKFKYGGFRGIKAMDTLSDERDVTRAQIWFHNPMYDQIRAAANREAARDRRRDSTLRSPASNSPPSFQRRSHGSSSRSRTQSIDQWAEQLAPTSIAPSQLTAGTLAQEIPDLEEPIAVFLLAISDLSDSGPQQTRRIKTLQYFTFPLREGVYIDASSCRCRSDRNCKILVIKSKGALNAQLYDHKQDLGNWNLAALGQSGHVDANKSVRSLEDLSRVMVTFNQAHERELFGEMMMKTIALYEAKRKERLNTIDNVRREDVVRG